MLDTLAHALTNLGDLAVLLPAAALFAAVLWRTSSHAAALAFLRSLASSMSALFVLKMLFRSCGEAWIPELISPSGHTGNSIAVYGAIATVIGLQLAGWRRAGAFAVGAALPLAIGFTRVSLEYHTLAEVIVGGIVGCGALASFVISYCRLKRSRINLVLLGSVLALSAFAAQGAQLPAEKMLRDWARYIRNETQVCENLR
jgi:membrane-associated phospholipid phosphatase